jgi:transcriptional regulator of aromatic amino acid metabolism
MTDSTNANANDKQKDMNKKENRKKTTKSSSDINEEQIMRYVQREFIKAYMTAYAQREVKENELVMFTKYLKNIKPVNTSSNHYVNRLKSLYNEMKGYYSQFQKLNYILGINFNQDRTN